MNHKARMKENLSSTWKKLIALFLFWIFLFPITFHETNYMLTVPVAINLFIFFLVIPYIGFVILSDDTRIIYLFIHISLYIAIILLLSYYLGIIGVHVGYHIYLLPIIYLFLVLVFQFLKKRHSHRC